MQQAQIGSGCHISHGPRIFLSTSHRILVRCSQNPITNLTETLITVTFHNVNNRQTVGGKSIVAHFVRGRTFPYGAELQGLTARYV